MQMLLRNAINHQTNIPVEIRKYGGPGVVKALTVNVRKSGPMDHGQETGHGRWSSLFRKRQHKYRMISLISHPSKVMLGVILSMLVNRAEQILEEYQAGFRSLRSTTEQLFNLRVLVEKYLVHQEELFHNRIDFKKAFDHVWHDSLYRLLKEYNIESRLIEVMTSFYDDATSTLLLLLNGSV